MAETEEIAAAPTLADGVDRRLDPQYVPFQRAIGWIVTAVISFSILATLAVTWLAVGRLRWFGLLIVPIWLAITAAVGWLSYALPPVEHRHTSYRLDDLGIEIRSGIFWREVKNVPRSRVQHIDVSQGPMERSYGLGRLVIYTAGTDHSRVELPGLNHGVAFQLRNHLLPRGADDAV